MSWGSKREGTSINIRLSAAAYEKIASRAARERRTFHDVLREAVELALQIWERGEDIIAERDRLRLQNERLRSRLNALVKEQKVAASLPAPFRGEARRGGERREAADPEPPPRTEERPPPPRRISRAVQERVLKEAQHRLEMLRQQQKKWARNLQFAPQDEQKSALRKLKSLETSIPIITTALAKGHKSLYEKRQERDELLSHGRVRGIALEESDKNISNNMAPLDPQELARLEEEEWFGDPW